MNDGFTGQQIKRVHDAMCEFDPKTVKIEDYFPSYEELVSTIEQYPMVAKAANAIISMARSNLRATNLAEQIAEDMATTYSILAIFNYLEEQRRG